MYRWIDVELGKRGEGGFAESMISLMAVIVALTLFMTILPTAFETTDEEEPISLKFLEGLSVSDGMLVSETDMHTMREDLGFSALKLNVRVPGDNMEFSFSSGSPVSDEIVAFSGTFLLPVDKGKVIASYELAVWR